MLWRAVAVLLMLSAVVAIVRGAVIEQALKEAVRMDRVERMVHLTRSVALNYQVAVSAGMDSRWVSALYAKAENARYCVVDGTGAVVMDTRPGALDCQDSRLVPIVEAARESDNAVHLFLPPSVRSSYALAIAVPVWHPDSPGSVLVGLFGAQKLNTELVMSVRSTIYGSMLVTLLPWIVLVILLVRNYLQVMSRVMGFVEAIDQDIPDLEPFAYSRDMATLAVCLNETHRRVLGALRSLRVEQHRLQTVLHAIDAGVVAVEGDDVVVINWAARRLLGWDPEALPVPMAEIPVDPAIRRALVRAAEGNTFVQARTIGGRQCVLSYGPVPGESGLPGAVMVIRDMTEQMRVQVMREHFTANVAHELRGPLSNLNLISEGLVNGTFSEAEARHYIQRMREEVLHLRQLSGDILDLAQIDAGVLTVDLEPVQISNVVNRVSVSHSEALVRHRLQLEIAVSADLWVIASPLRLEQVISNLVENAIENTEPGCSIRIAARRHSDWVYITVSDTGQGIAEEDLPFIFDRFYRADKARTHSQYGRGTGLGLSLVKNLVELQGGSVDVQSKLGEGATFRVALRFCADPSEATSGA